MKPLHHAPFSHGDGHSQRLQRWQNVTRPATGQRLPNPAAPLRRPGPENPRFIARAMGLREKGNTGTLLLLSVVTGLGAAACVVVCMRTCVTDWLTESPTDRQTD